MVPKKNAVVVSWSWSSNNSVVLVTDSIVSNDVCVTVVVGLVPSCSNILIVVDSCGDVVTLEVLSTFSIENVEKVFFSILAVVSVLVVMSKVVVSTIGELVDNDKVDRISVVAS